MSFELPTRKSQDIKLQSFVRNGKETLQTWETHSHVCRHFAAMNKLVVPFWGDGDLDLIQNDLWPSFIESFLWKVNWFKVSQKLVKERRLEGNFPCVDLSSTSFTRVNTQAFFPFPTEILHSLQTPTYAINKEREVQFRFRVLFIRNHSSFLDFIDSAF